MSVHHRVGTPARGSGAARDHRDLPPLDTVGVPRRVASTESETKSPTSPHITHASATSAGMHAMVHGEAPGTRPGTPRARTSSASARRVGSPITSPLATRGDGRAMSPVSGRAWTPSLRTHALGRAAAHAAQSFVDVVARSLSPNSLQHAPASHFDTAEGRRVVSTSSFGEVLSDEPEEVSPEASTAVLHPRRRGSSAGFRARAPTRGAAEAPQPERRGTPLRAFSLPAGETSAEQAPHTATPHESAWQHTPAGTPYSAPAHAAPAAGLVAPQARHGAVCLHLERGAGSPLAVRGTCRGARRRARRRARKGRGLSRQQIASALRFGLTCMRALTRPREASANVARYASGQLYYWDQAFRDPATGARCWVPPWVRAYVPLLIWLGISLCSTAVVLLFHTQVFQALDAMSHALRDLGLAGRVILGVMIFLTTFPPLPLYSTLIVVSGFAFGTLQGFVVSYIAALLGAMTVFSLSRSYMRAWMVHLLNQSGGLRKVVQAIERRPQLLFFVRLAPYPYNLLNTLLASSPSLSLRTFSLCTALALFKLFVHTGLGASIKNFAAFHGAAGDEPLPESDEERATTVHTYSSDGLAAAHAAAASPQALWIKQAGGLLGGLLCVGIFFYIYCTTRRAVSELGEDQEEADVSTEEDELDALYPLSDEEQDGVEGFVDQEEFLDEKPQVGTHSYPPPSTRLPIWTSPKTGAPPAGPPSMEEVPVVLPPMGSAPGPAVFPPAPQAAPSIADQIAEMERAAEGQTHLRHKSYS